MVLDFGPCPPLTRFSLEPSRVNASYSVTRGAGGLSRGDRKWSELHFLCGALPVVSMKAVILAAGYGTRLQRDVAADPSGRFAHLAGIAKPLLPIGRRALASHWVHALTTSGCVDGIYVVVSSCGALRRYSSARQLHIMCIFVICNLVISN